MMMIGELVFLIVGALFLVRALSPIKRLISELPDGTLKRRWRLLINLTLFFLLFYFVFGYNLWLLRESVTILSILGSLMTSFRRYRFLRDGATGTSNR